MSSSRSDATQQALETEEISSKILARLVDAGLSVRADAIPLMAIQLRLLFQWNKAVSLTSLRSLDEAIERHVVESLRLVPLIPFAVGRMVDVGSGAGYPALPLKCAFPGLDLIMLEPALRKSHFLREASAAMGLEGIEVLRERVDRPADLARHAPVDIVTMRAVGAIVAVIRGADEALSPTGRILLLVGHDSADLAVRKAPRGLKVLDRRLMPGRRVSEILVLGR